jgi:hypothetical protein
VSARHLRSRPRLFFETQIVLVEALGLSQLTRTPRLLPSEDEGRLCSVRVVARKKPRASHFLDKAKIPQAYEARLR